MNPLRVGSGTGVAAEVAVTEPVAVAFEGDDLGLVDEAVDHGSGDDVVAEHFTPAAEGLIGGDDEAGTFVAGGDELETGSPPRARRGCSRPRRSMRTRRLCRGLWGQRPSTRLAVTGWLSGHLGIMTGSASAHRGCRSGCTVLGASHQSGSSPFHGCSGGRPTRGSSASSRSPSGRSTGASNAEAAKRSQRSS